MSDFGTMVIARRRDGQAATDQDRGRFNQAVQVVQTASLHRDATGEPFRFRITESHLRDGRRDLAILLSEYWGEGVDEGLYEDRTVEELLDEDRPKAMSVLAALRVELGAEYELELICNTW
jgi:hypothetical protein